MDQTTQSSNDSAVSVPVPASSSIADRRNELGHYVLDRTGYLDSERPSGSHLIGIGTKAIRALEVLLRDLLKHYVSTCRLRHGITLLPSKEVRAIDNLTLGQVIGRYHQIQAGLAQCRGLDLVTDDLENKLRQINSLRKQLVHFEDEPNRAAEPVEKMRELLTLIGDVIQYPLFDV